MKKLKSLKILAILFSLGFFLGTGFFQQVKAQQVSLSLTPPLVEVMIKPGKSILVAYTISNYGDPVFASSSIVPFSPKNAYGDISLDREFSGPIRFNLENSNIQLNQPFFLKQKEGQQLLLKMRVPEGTPEGDYYYTFLVTTEKGKIGGGPSASKAIASIGANILITVTETGQIEVNPRISQFAITPRFTFNMFGKTYSFVESTDIVPVSLTVTNNGKNSIKPEGTIELRNTFGKNAEYSILPQNILTQSSRLLTATSSAILSDNQKIRNTRSTVNINGFFVGKQTLQALLTFPGGKSLSSVVIFYGIPFNLIIALGVVSVIGIVLIKKLSSDKDTTSSRQTSPAE